MLGTKQRANLRHIIFIKGMKQKLQMRNILLRCRQICRGIRRILRQLLCKAPMLLQCVAERHTHLAF